MEKLERAKMLLEKAFKEKPRIASEVEKVNVIPTKIVDLDRSVLGIGGMPRGKLTVLYGPEMSGKSSLAENIIARLHESDPNAIAAWFDMEGSFDPEFAKSAGVDLERLLLPESIFGEDAYEKIKMLLDEVDIIVVDSIAMMRSKDIQSREFGDNAQVAANARMNEMYLADIITGTVDKKFHKKTKRLSETNTALIFLNHVRANFSAGFYGKKTKQYGGHALMHDAHIILELSVVGYGDKDENGRPTKQKIKIKCTKNRLATPFRETEVWLDFDNHISQWDISTLINIGIEKAILDRRGAWIYWDALPDGKVQGAEKFAEILTEREDLLNILLESNEKEDDYHVEENGETKISIK